MGKKNVVALIISNIKFVSVPGNSRFKKGTAGLPKTNVIVVSKIATVGKLRLLEKIGTLSRKKNEEVIENCRKVISLKMF